ncbi:hypothetical protein KJ966_09290 [bacterium]|nr:hypothetical protein [bacterium]
MKKGLLYLMIGALTVFMFACDEPPMKEMNVAKASVDAVVTQGGDIYAISETKMLNESYAKALDEVVIQDQKFFKDYKAARELLEKVPNEAAALEQVIGARKETAKRNALSVLNTTEVNITETVALLANAPKGKGSEMDVAAMQNDLKALEESLNEAKKLIQAEDYLSVPEKVTPIQLKVTQIAFEVKSAIEKKNELENAKKLAVKKTQKKAVASLKTPVNKKPAGIKKPSDEKKTPIKKKQTTS